MGRSATRLHPRPGPPRGTLPCLCVCVCVNPSVRVPHLTPNPTPRSPLAHSLLVSHFPSLSLSLPPALSRCTRQQVAPVHAAPVHARGRWRSSLGRSCVRASVSACARECVSVCLCLSVCLCVCQSVRERWDGRLSLAIYLYLSISLLSALCSLCPRPRRPRLPRLSTSARACTHTHTQTYTRARSCRHEPQQHPQLQWCQQPPQHRAAPPARAPPPPSPPAGGQPAHHGARWVRLQPSVRIRPRRSRWICRHRPPRQPAEPARLSPACSCGLAIAASPIAGLCRRRGTTR